MDAEWKAWVAVGMHKLTGSVTTHQHHMVATPHARSTFASPMTGAWPRPAVTQQAMDLDQPLDIDYEQPFLESGVDDLLAPLEWPFSATNNAAPDMLQVSNDAVVEPLQSLFTNLIVCHFLYDIGRGARRCNPRPCGAKTGGIGPTSHTHLRAVGNTGWYRPGQQKTHQRSASGYQGCQAAPIGCGPRLD